MRYRGTLVSLTFVKYLIFIFCAFSYYIYIIVCMLLQILLSFNYAKKKSVTNLHELYLFTWYCTLCMIYINKIVCCIRKINWATLIIMEKIRKYHVNLDIKHSPFILFIIPPIHCWFICINKSTMNRPWGYQADEKLKCQLHMSRDYRTAIRWYYRW